MVLPMKVVLLALLFLLHNGKVTKSTFEKTELNVFYSEHENDEKDGAAFDLEGTDHEISLLLGYIKEKLDKELQHIG